MVSIFSHTQLSFKQALFSLFGKGKQHAASLYSEWFRAGSLQGEWAEPQAQGLVKKMISAIDCSLPQQIREHEEGEISKFLLQFSDQLISESVLIPMESGITLCISSQIGCAMGCAFCETGKMGLLRHLSCCEIVQQAFWARFVLKKRIRNIVFMGMGEPFDNFDEVRRAVEILTDEGGFGLGKSRITLSTSGRVDGIYRMINEMDPAVNLAVSVNAPNDEVRQKIMPINRTWNMEQLKEAMRAYCAHPRREIFVEYVLIQGVNDKVEDADQLALYLQGLRVKVNLIPYNPQKRDRFMPPDETHREAFLQRMRGHGFHTLLRGTKGQKIMAACGQLGDVDWRRQYVTIPSRKREG